MSSLSGSGFDFFGLVRLAQQRIRWFLGLTLLFALLIVVKTRPRFVGLAAGWSNEYTSTGVLLVQPYNRAVMYSIFGSTSHSDVEIWLDNTGIFAKFLERNGVNAKIEKELKKRLPRLNLRGREVAIQLEVRGREYSQDHRETDYATLETGARPQDEKRETGIFARITLTASADNPEDSLTKVKVGMEVFQRVMLEVATKRVRSQRKVVERYIELGKEKIARAERYLDRTQGFPDKAFQSRLFALNSNCSRLERQILDLQSQIQTLSGSDRERFLTVPGLIHSIEEERARNKLASEQLYLPDSQTLQRSKGQWELAHRLLQNLREEAKERELASLRAALQAKQFALEHERSELAQESARQLSPEARRDLAVAERELLTWQTELNAWQQRLIQARIQEQLCRADGTVLVLQEPLKGRRTWMRALDLKTRYAKTLKWLPVAPLLSFILIVLSIVWQEVREVRWRLEYYCDAPVLVHLPPVNQSHRRRWLRSKKTGTWH